MHSRQMYQPGKQKHYTKTNFQFRCSELFCPVVILTIKGVLTKRFGNKAKLRSWHTLISNQLWWNWYVSLSGKVLRFWKLFKISIVPNCNITWWNETGIHLSTYGDGIKTRFKQTKQKLAWGNYALDVLN